MTRLSRADAKQRTRKEVLDAAAKVFAARGYEGASVHEIAEVAERTTGAIYTHFPTKEALFLALLSERYHARAPYRRENINAEGQRPGDYVADWFAADANPNDGWNLLLIEFFLYSIRHPEPTTEYRKRMARGRDAIAGILANVYEESGSPPPLEPRHLAVLLLALQDGLRLQQQANPELPIRDLYAYALRQLVEP
jgi:AcrR family transcriptional regulator